MRQFYCGQSCLLSVGSLYTTVLRVGGNMIDVQSGRATSGFAIESVGVTGLRYPLVARDSATGEEQATLANWRMAVALPAEKRGTHMSRFVAALEARGRSPLGLDEHCLFASHLTQLLGAESADIEVEFTWFRLVKAPVTGQAAQLECKVAFLAVTGPKAMKTLRVQVAAKALCPCSKAVADRGAHNQRSDIEVQVHFAPGALVPAIGTILSLLEGSASSPIYPLLKRDDEKYVTEYAYDHPVFVEDIVRNAATKLVLLPAISAFQVQAINRESIHAHDCYARIVWSRV